MVASIFSGGTPTDASENWDGDIPFVTPPDLNGLDGKIADKTERFLTRYGAKSSSLVEYGVAVSCRAPIGHIGAITQTSAFNQGCKVASPRDPIDTAFLAYALLANRETMEISGRGTTFTEMSTTAFSNIKIPWPTSSTRRRITEYLDEETRQIDATITRIDKVVELLEERREAFRMSTLFGTTSSVLTTKQSRLGPQIPSHWTESKFGLEFREISEFVGTSPNGPLLSISEYRGVELNNRTDGQRPSQTVSHYRTLRRGQLAVNTMWLNHGGLAVSDLDGYISPDYRAYDVSPKLDPRFTHFLMRSKPMVDYFAVVSTGVRPNAQRVTSTVLQNVPVVVPPLDEQQKISQILSQQGEESSHMINTANSVKDLLKERRSALITAAVTGKIEV